MQNIYHYRKYLDGTSVKFGKNLFYEERRPQETKRNAL